MARARERERDARRAMTDAEDVELRGAAEIARKQREELVREFESRRRLRATHAPTHDADVRAMLRKYREPITLFGERESERRDRLRALLASLDARDGGELDDGAGTRTATDKYGATIVDEGEYNAHATQKETFYTEGTERLLECRIDIAEWSLPRAAKRVATQREARGKGGRKDERATIDAVVASTSGFQAQCSEIGDASRPICEVKFYNGGRNAVSASWSGEARKWACDVEGGKLTSELVIRASDHRITGIDAFDAGDGRARIVTGHADGSAAIWNADGSRAAELKGHASRCGRVAFHPHGGKYVATASFDATWRLWSAETGEELLCQEGHAKEVYDVAFHPDGSLAASVGLDAVGRVWDLRIGKSIAVLRGHVKQILSVDFSPNGYHVVTGGDDRTVKSWDLRKSAECAYTNAAHSALVSCVRYEKTSSNGAFFTSSSYDGSVVVYSARDFAPHKKIGDGAAGKLTAVDVAGDALILSGFDRTLKYYTK